MNDLNLVGLHGNISAIENRNDFDTSAAHTQSLADQLDVLCVLAISPAPEFEVPWSLPNMSKQVGNS